MAAYQLFDFSAKAIDTLKYDTSWATADGSAVRVQVDVYANHGGTFTSLIRTLIDGDLYFNRKPVTYGSRREAEIHLRARLDRTFASMARKVAAHDGSFPRARR